MSRVHGLVSRSIEILVEPTFVIPAQENSSNVAAPSEGSLLGPLLVRLGGHTAAIGLLISAQ